MSGEPQIEDIMAYADGALSAARRVEIQQAWTSNPRIRRLVHDFRLTRAAASSAFNCSVSSSAMADLVAVIRNWPVGDPSSGQLRPRVPVGDPARFPSPAAAAAIAAAGALILSSGLWHAADNRNELSALTMGEVLRGSELSTALEAVSRGAPAYLQGERLSVAQLIPDKFGNECWEIDVLQGATSAARTNVFVACRNSMRSWSVVAAMTAIPFRSARRGHYFATEEEANSAFSGILAAIGAQQQTTELREETND